MKYSVIVIVFILMSFGFCSQEDNRVLNSEITTYYFIRHAEKDRSNPSESNPHLLPKGLERAKKWNSILGKINFDAVYSTDFHRTKETAKPTADKNNLNIIIYDPDNPNTIDGFLHDTKGKTVLVVGHSNTTPAFVNTIIGQEKYENIDDNNNGNLYIVTIIEEQIADQVLTIN